MPKHPFSKSVQKYHFFFNRDSRRPHFFSVMAFLAEQDPVSPLESFVSYLKGTGFREGIWLFQKKVRRSKTVICSYFQKTSSIVWSSKSYIWKRQAPFANAHLKRGNGRIRLADCCLASK